VVLVEDKAILYILVTLVLLVGGFALGIFSLDIFFSSITLGGIVSTILFALLGLCCHGIDRQKLQTPKYVMTFGQRSK
jgi:hypothetical protein